MLSGGTAPLGPQGIFGQQLGLKWAKADRATLLDRFVRARVHGLCVIRLTHEGMRCVDQFVSKNDVRWNALQLV